MKRYAVTGFLLSSIIFSSELLFPRMNLMASSSNINQKFRGFRMAQKTYTSSELFGGLHEIVILHEGEAYRLRITSNNKLIMTK